MAELILLQGVLVLLVSLVGVWSVHGPKIAVLSAVLQAVAIGSSMWGYYRGYYELGNSLILTGIGSLIAAHLAVRIGKR
jgi:hypothetical protein